MKTRWKVDGSAAIDQGLICTGASSPFQCKLTAPIPIGVQTVGQHRFEVEASNLDIDGSYTPYVNILDFTVAFSNGAGTPQKGQNPKIIKGGS